MLKEYNELKQKLLENEFSGLNREQKRAVFTSGGHMLILAGAGSGKTTTVVNKIAFLMKYGNAYCGSRTLPENIDENALQYMRAFADMDAPPDDYITDLIKNNPVRPYNILAFTFTNKAASEMKERIAAAAGAGALDMWIGTFHSICIRILRRNIDNLFGYDKNFVIYDTADQQTLMKTCLESLNISEKLFPPKEVLHKIGRAKDSLMGPEEFIQTADTAKDKMIGEIYKFYQGRLRSYNALDFDDIINHTVNLLDTYEEIRSYYAEKFRYVLVDEYQDTNKAQYKLISLLASGSGNLCVVGDDDQSIYGWRGADIQNIIDFEDNYKNCSVIRLEQNYRSTQNILDAANYIIMNNTNRKGKNLWTAAEGGDKIEFYLAQDDRDEAFHSVEKLTSLVFSENKKYSDFAYLYRTHAQSRIIEDALIRAGIPYRVVGGVRFYERKEIKDIMAYLKVISNPQDSISLKRIINFPKRGIGDTTVEKLEIYAEKNNEALIDVIKNESCEEVQRAQKKLTEFSALIDSFAQYSQTASPSELINHIIVQAQIDAEYLKEGEIEGLTRIENIHELISVAAELEETGEAETLNDFLEYASLVTDTDVSDDNADCVALMTIHAAKGLEFPVVFITGMEEGLFPKTDPYAEDESKLEEERRLCYVAITRAKEKLFLSAARQRMMFGRTAAYERSRFIDELPEELIDFKSEYNFSNLKTNCYEKEEYVCGGKKIEKERLAKSGSEEKKSFFSYKPAPVKREKAPSSNFSVGDRVMHKKFGEGTVTEVSGSESLVILSINFDSCGGKKIMANAVTAM